MGGFYYLQVMHLENEKGEITSNSNICMHTQSTPLGPIGNLIASSLRTWDEELQMLSWVSSPESSVSKIYSWSPCMGLWNAQNTPPDVILEGPDCSWALGSSYIYLNANSSQHYTQAFSLLKNCCDPAIMAQKTTPRQKLYGVTLKQ